MRFGKIPNTSGTSSCRIPKFFSLGKSVGFWEYKVVAIKGNSYTGPENTYRMNKQANGIQQMNLSSK